MKVRGFQLTFVALDAKSNPQTSVCTSDLYPPCHVFGVWEGAPSSHMWWDVNFALALVPLAIWPNHSLARGP